jgi:uncharacterized protein (TIGR00251 family)
MPTSITVAVHARPAASRNAVGGQHDGALRIAVTAVADKGKANQAIRKSLAKALDIRLTSIEILSGHTHRRKVFRISDPTSGIEDRIQELMNQ